MNQGYMWDDYYRPANDEPYLSVLNYSAGRQSHCLARRILRGELDIPERFLVVAADPGNEHCDTVRIRDRTLAEFNAAGIHAVLAPGPTMLEDLKEKKAGDGSHLDQPSQWTENGSQLPQHCTRHYKIRPMDRVVKAYLRQIGVADEFTHLPRGFVHRWIGFAFDETARHGKWSSDNKTKHGVMSGTPAKYLPSWEQCRSPLIESKETKQDVLDWYEATGEEMPPPSVCNHCWANGTETFKRIHDTDKRGWNRAVEYDKLSRDLSQFGVEQSCFCSRTLIPLEELAKGGFAVTSGDAQVLSCDSGACFL